MSLPAFDAEKHHIGLAAHGDAKKGFLIEGAYARSLQRENTVPGASEFGGSLDLIARIDSPNLSRWTQDDFTGGAFSFRFDNDPAMFQDSTGYIPGQQSKSLQSVPPVVLRAAFDPLAEDQHGYSDDDCSIPRAMFTVAGSIYILFKHGLARFRQDTEAFSWGDWLIDTNHYYVDAQYDLNEQLIYVLLGTTLSTDSPVLLRISPTSLDSTPYAIGSFDPSTPLPKTKGKPAKGMQIMGQTIVTGIGLRLYTCGVPQDVTDVLDLPTWTHIGRLPGYWIDSVAYNGLIYILCGSVDGKTYLVAFDGTAVLPVCEFPFNFRGHALCVYGGRVYCGGSGTGLTAGERFAELYEITGASVRLVRTFADQYHAWNSSRFPRQIWDLTVDEGLLWMTQKAKKCWAYDLTSDGFFGAAELPNEPIVFFKQAIGLERLWLYGRHDSDSAQHGLYAIAENSAFVNEAGFTPFVQTSNFVIEPALDKNWKKLVVLAQGNAVTCQWSQDGGESWNAFASETTITDDSNMVYTECVFPADTSTRHISFKISQPHGTDITSNAILAYTASFEFADPALTNSMKNGWQFTILASENAEAYDGTNQAQLPADFAQLFTWAKDQTLLDFTDVDGSTYTVKLQAITEQRPRIGPPVAGVPEAYYSVSLLEATS